MPVIEKDIIAGAITRTDLLRTIYEEFLKRRRLDKSDAGEKPSIGRNIAVLLKEKFPAEIYAILKLAGEIADQLGINAYLVGGSVRDLLRGEENLDIDIVVEGDGISFAKAFGRKLNAKIRTHERFGTAKIYFESRVRNSEIRDRTQNSSRTSRDKTQDRCGNCKDRVL